MVPGESSNRERIDSSKFAADPGLTKKEASILTEANTNPVPDMDPTRPDKPDRLNS